MRILINQNTKQISQEQRIQGTYDWLDELFRASMGQFADFSGAYYCGDFNLSLEEAQLKKHKFILESIHFEPGMRVLDVGSGWGPMLKFIRDNGGNPVGLTLSKRQAKHTMHHGFEVYLKDWRDVSSKDLGQFDAVISIEGLEHFCNVEQYLAGQQDEIYEAYFEFVRSLIPVGGRTYLQTTTWGNPHPEYNQISLDAPKGSPEYIVAHLRNFYEASGWLPDGVGHIMKTANGFMLISESSGRLDYIQTSEEWKKHFNRAMLTKPWIIAKLAPKLLNGHFRDKIRSGRYGAQRKAFEQGIFEHTRMVLEKV